MECQKWAAAVIDSARAGRPPGTALRAHLDRCPGCSERWSGERILTREMQILADRVANIRAPGRVREAVEREFERNRRAARARWTAFALAAAAAMVMVAALGSVWWKSVTSSEARHATAQWADAGSGFGAGFVAVPGALPLADGEFVRVERTELEPAALARMGLSLPDPDDDLVVADVAVGEDGMPRAVRLEADPEAVD